MKPLLVLLTAALFAACASTAQPADEGEWISLFDGETLTGWQANENPEAFRVEDGTILVNGPRAHLFYVGPVENHEFRNFEFMAEVMTTPGSNSGIYFHTVFQDEGWPEQGYEAQINNSYEHDWRKTGSLYAVADVREAVARDSVWFTQHIIVRDSLIQILVDGDTLVSFVETPDAAHFAELPNRRLGRGTFALQSHHPGTPIRYRNLRVRPLK